jgi:hypothetical protein
MMHRRHLGIGILFGSAFLVINVASAEGKRVSFETCPIARDTSEVLCWMVEYQGKMYYLGIQGNQFADWYPPMLRHRVIVEDAKIAADGNQICGGIVLEDFVSSPVAELDPSCDTLLPAEDRYKPPAGYKEALVKMMMGGGPTEGLFRHPNPVIPPTPPFTARSFTVLYDFDFITSRMRSVPQVEAAADYARVAKWHATISAGRGAVKLSDGTVLVERDGIAERRAESLQKTLEALGVPKKQIEIHWNNTEAAPQGFEDWRNRSATITVHP